MPRKKKEVENTTEEKEAPTAQPSVAVPGSFGFNFLEQSESIMETVQDTVMTLAARRKNRPTQFRSMADVRKEMLQVDDILLQYLFDNPGIPQGALVEIIGAESTGKSTLVHYIEAAALLRGCPVYHQECENKPLMVNHVARIMSGDPVMGKRLVKAIHFDTARSLEESYEKLMDWIFIMRGQETAGRKAAVTIPLHVPLVAVIDPWGKLMSKDEAAGFYDFGKNMTEKEKPLLELSNLGHSKAAHRWVRRLPYVLGDLNVILIIVQHQNTKVDMSGAGSPMSAEAGAMYNTTKIGGKGFDQLDSMQIILGRKGLVKDSSGTAIGKTIRARMNKSSYGAESRVVEYDLINDGYKDAGGRLDRVLRFDRTTTDFLLEKGVLDMSVKLRRVTCPPLELAGASYKEFYATLLANREVLSDVCKKLKIKGYYDPLEELLAAGVEEEEEVLEETPETEPTEE
jgi:hypothetical protein